MTAAWPAPAVPLTDDCYHVLSAMLEERFGLTFPPHRRMILEARLQERLRAHGLDRFLDYYTWLRVTGEGALDELASAVTNNETYLFREADQIAALFEQARGTPQRILCAGCSSGEEAFTISMHARDLASPPAQVAIDAFDLDLDRLEIARRGECRERSLRRLTHQQVERYLEPAAAGRWTVRARFREGVQFFQGNLVEPATFRALPQYDAVFCRNVLIYFSERTIRRAVLHLASVLRPGGLLFLGHSESIIGLVPELETMRVGKCIAYRRRTS